MSGRVRVLAEPGTLLISTDLHGKRDSFERLRERFFALRERSNDPVHWALLGDLVHGPNPAARARNPALYDYDDESPALIDAVFELRERWPDHVHFVLGNHDHGHVGGPHTRKFHDDEVVALEARLTPEQHERAQRLYASLGFRGYAREPDAVRIGDGFVDEIQMVRYLRREPRTAS